MADFPAVSPLLDGFTVGECFSNRDGVSCYALRHDASGQDFVLKHISVPASETKTQALLLSGAYTDTQAIHAYYKRVADSLSEEFSLSKSFADCPYILHYLAHQVVAKKDAPGFDIYAVSDKAVSLKAYLADNALTKLQAVNLGIDLCAALGAVRSAGYLYQDIKPENVFLDSSRFLLGDIGFTSLQDMNYTSLPEEYIGSYTAPELYNIMEGQNATTDIYAVGMLLYRIYNGDHAPFEDEKITSKEADHMRVSGKELPVPMYADYELAAILLKACAFRPEDRYTSPAQMKQALEQYMQRNAIEDTLIVPPIVCDAEPEHFDDGSDIEVEEAAPVRFADVSELDEDFIQHFTPDTAALDAAIEQFKQDEAKEAAKAAAQEAARQETDALVDDIHALLDGEASAEELPAEEVPAEEIPVEDASAEEAEAPAEAVVSGDVPEEVPEETPATEALPAEVSAEEVAEEAPAEEASVDTPEKESSEEASVEEGAAPAEAGDGSLRLVYPEAAPKVVSPFGIQSDEEEDTPAKAKKSKPKNGKKTLAIVLGCIVALLVAALIIYFFTPLGQKIYHYTINIEQLEVEEVTTDFLSVRVVTNVDEPPLVFACKDAYGNSIPADFDGEYARFSQLESGTAYTITATLQEDAGPHRLSGTTSVSASTLPSTEILDMTVSSGTEEGAVVIDLVVKEGDPEPSFWTISYVCAGQTDKELSFSGEERRFVIRDLEIEKEYTFQLMDSDLFKVTGETSAVYTPAKAVTAQGLTMTSFVEGTLTLGWECTSQMPEVWTLSCTDADGNIQTAETTECIGSFTGLTLGEPYTVKVEARGLFIPLTLEIPENLIHIDQLTATEADDGLHVFWSSTSAPADTEWILLCVPDGDTAASVSYNTTASGLVLTDLLPDTLYTLTVKSADGSTVVGHCSLSHNIPLPENFDSRGVSVDHTTLTTHALPEGDDWNARELTESKTSFNVGDTIVYKVMAPTGRYYGSFSVLYVLRDENGTPVDYASAQYVWNEVWAWDNAGYYSMAGTLTAPERNGTFTLEVYFSYDLDGYIQYKFVAASEAFTVSGAAEQ